MAQHSAALFPGASNTTLNNSPVVMNVNNSRNHRIERLLDVVAPNAILNAGGRADEVRCYPGTREGVIGKMEKWMDDKGLRTSRMMWLNGPAGAGKSAIMQTAAERCQTHGRHAANFFFFRSDETRKHAQALVATLVYQLRALYPALDKLLEACLAATPLILKASIGEQFDKLISSPIRVIQNSSSIPQPIILLVDGLDECDDKPKQEQILVALQALAENDDTLFRVLVASRAEPHIIAFFNKIGVLAVSILLDDEYRPEDDIRCFVVAKFDEIRTTHHLAHTLDKYWPTTADIDAIIDKSSGQFIYAATVMRFTQYSTASPRLSLLIVHGIRPAADHDPYAQLDAVYSYVFSKSHNIQAVIFCLSVDCVIGMAGGPSNQQKAFENFLQYTGYEPTEMESLFADLVAIVDVRTTPDLQLAFYHASLHDYLVDESRSGIYHVDVHRISTEIVTMCLAKLIDPSSWVIGVCVLALVEEATPALSKCLLEATKCKLDIKKFMLGGGSWSEIITRGWMVLIVSIYRLYFVSDPALHKRMLQLWIRFAYINIPGIDTITLRDFAQHSDCPDNMLSDIQKDYNWYIRFEGLKYMLMG